MTSERSIVGTYRADAPCETIVLAVNQDHSFVQSVHTRTTEINRLSGKWSSDNYGVTFRPFLDFLNEGNGSRLEFASCFARGNAQRYHNAADNRKVPRRNPLDRLHQIGDDRMLLCS